jgi:hypothetical protein
MGVVFRGIVSKGVVGGTPVNAADAAEFNTAGVSSFTVPAGVTSVTIKLWGGGGGAGANNPMMGENAGGGGGGGYASKVLTVTPAQVLSFTVGTGGTAATVGSFYNGGNGTASTYSAVSAGGGDGGTDGGVFGQYGGAGGTSSGGDVNTSGSIGGYNFYGLGYGGASPNGGAQQNTNAANGNAPGGGGCSGNHGGAGVGANGRVRFEW